MLRSHSVGGLNSVTVDGPADEDAVARAGRLGARVAPASLADLVAAYGSDTPEPIVDMKGALA